MSDRRGFTIVEVVIAIVIFSLGILGLVGTAASVTRMVARSQQQNKAATLSANRLEILRATRCASMAGGSATDGRYSIAWTVADTGQAKKVTITVSMPTARGIRTDTTSSYISCTL